MQHLLKWRKSFSIYLVIHEDRIFREHRIESQTKRVSAMWAVYTLYRSSYYHQLSVPSKEIDQEVVTYIMRTQSCQWFFCRLFESTTFISEVHWFESDWAIRCRWTSFKAARELVGCKRRSRVTIWGSQPSHRHAPVTVLVEQFVVILEHESHIYRVNIQSKRSPNDGECNSGLFKNSSSKWQNTRSSSVCSWTSFDIPMEKSPSMVILFAQLGRHLFQGWPNARPARDLQCINWKPPGNCATKRSWIAW